MRKLIFHVRIRPCGSIGDAARTLAMVRTVDIIIILLLLILQSRSYTPDHSRQSTQVSDSDDVGNPSRSGNPSFSGISTNRALHYTASVWFDSSQRYYYITGVLHDQLMAT